MPHPTKSRQACPCCGYPTLRELGSYESCELCNWVENGQGDAEASEVWGGPNLDYSLTEARQNFLQYRVMYSPGRDPRIVAGDTPLEYETKGLLMAAFTRLRDSRESPPRVAEVALLERILLDKTTRRVREYEQRSSRGTAFATNSRRLNTIPNAMAFGSLALAIASWLLMILMDYYPPRGNGKYLIFILIFIDFTLSAGAWGLSIVAYVLAKRNNHNPLYSFPRFKVEVAILGVLISAPLLLFFGLMFAGANLFGSH